MQTSHGEYIRAIPIEADGPRRPSCGRCGGDDDLHRNRWYDGLEYLCGECSDYYSGTLICSVDGERITGGYIRLRRHVYVCERHEQPEPAETLTCEECGAELTEEQAGPHLDDAGRCRTPDVRILTSR